MTAGEPLFWSACGAIHTSPHGRQAYHIRRWLAASKPTAPPCPHEGQTVEWHRTFVPAITWCECSIRNVDLARCHIARSVNALARNRRSRPIRVYSRFGGKGFISTPSHPALSASGTRSGSEVVASTSVAPDSPVFE